VLSDQWVADRGEPTSDLHAILVTHGALGGLSIDHDQSDVQLRILSDHFGWYSVSSLGKLHNHFFRVSMT